MELLIQKYGGSSVATIEQIQDVARHIIETKNSGFQVIVVVSAMGNETNELLELAGQVSDTQPKSELDMLITSGERKAAALLSIAIASHGISATSLSGEDIGLQTNTKHQQAKIHKIQSKRLQELLDQDCIPVVAGSQGISFENRVTFLGRGGSDTTAVALAHSLNATECELYTDVSGIFTADPQLVKSARKISTITYDELLDMTATGCPKPAMRAVEVARNFQVPLHIRSAFNWKEGTKVNKKATNKNMKEKKESLEQAIVSAVTHDVSEAKITINGVPDKPGIAAALFRNLANEDLHIDMIVQNVASSGSTDISFTLPLEELDRGIVVTQAFSKEVGANNVDAKADICRVSLVGAGMKTHSGVAATMFEILAEAGINIEMISTSSIRISCVIDESKLDKAVNALHSAFELEKK